MTRQIEFLDETGKSFYIDWSADWEPDYLVVGSNGVFSDSMTLKRVPPVSEPKGIGAVVRAWWNEWPDAGEKIFILGHDGLWRDDEEDEAYWANLEKIEVLSEGWVDNGQD